MRTAIVILMLSAMLAPGVSRAFIIDRVEAVVNGEVITKSEVDRSLKAEARRRGLTDKGETARLREEVLDSLISRELILGDARRFNIVDVTPEEVGRAVASLMAGYASEEDFREDLRDDEMTMDELREEIAEQLLVVKYVDRRVRFFVRVTLDDQKRYYREHAEDFGGRSFADVHDEIYGLLMEKYTDDKLTQYIEDLRGRADIDVNRYVR